MQNSNHFPHRDKISDKYIEFIKAYDNQTNRSEYLKNFVSAPDEEHPHGQPFMDIVIDDAIDLLAAASMDLPEQEWPIELAKDFLEEKGDVISMDEDSLVKLARDTLAEKIDEHLAKRSSEENEKIIADIPQHWSILFERMEEKPELKYFIGPFKKHWLAFTEFFPEAFKTKAAETARIVSNHHSSYLKDTFNQYSATASRDLKDEQNISQNTRTDAPHLFDNNRLSEDEDYANDEDIDDDADYLRYLYENIKHAIPEKVRSKIEEQFRRLEKSDAVSGGAASYERYLETILALPWAEETELEKDLPKIEQELEASHYGLHKVKEKILYNVAVQNRVGSGGRAPIICLAGPPGVGKTSITEAIAKITGRELISVALGGESDPRVLKGFARTYMDSEPGLIIRELKECKTSNPLIRLDEIDKLGQNSTAGDPSSTLLEILDSEQNHDFRDTYLDVGFDLSKSMFICTANDIDKLPDALRDRMDIIPIPGYVFEEKLKIARQYLVDKQIHNAGLKENEFTITDGALGKIIEDYTHEAGVRELNRKIANLCSKVVYLIDKETVRGAHITEENLADYLDPVTVSSHEKILQDSRIGLVNGLAFTPHGGSLAKFEAIVTTSAHRATEFFTGSLQDVMSESVRVARDLIDSMGEQSFFNNRVVDTGKLKKISNLRIHVPDGATPKDGPSAGIALTTAMMSALAKIPVKNDIAMTGEITLHGDVLPIGGLKYKLEAARQAGVKTVLIPQDNIPDIKDIPQSTKEGLKILAVSRIEQVFQEALEKPVLKKDFDPAIDVSEAHGSFARALAANANEPDGPDEPPVPAGMG